MMSQAIFPALDRLNRFHNFRNHRPTKMNFAKPDLPTIDRLQLHVAAMKREQEKVKRLLILTQECFTVIKNLTSRNRDEDKPEMLTAEFKYIQENLKKLVEHDVNLDYRISGAIQAEDFRLLRVSWGDAIDLLTVHLPFKYTTLIKRDRCNTIENALMMPLQLFDLPKDLCRVGRNDSVQLKWDDLMNSVKGDDITVRMWKRGIHEATNNLHDPVLMKIFYSMVICDVCEQLLFYGLWCDKCNFRSHLGCGKYAPFDCPRLEYLARLRPPRLQPRQTQPYIGWQRSRSLDNLVDLESCSNKLDTSPVSDDYIVAGANTFGTVFNGHWHGPMAVKKFVVEAEKQRPSEEAIEDFVYETTVGLSSLDFHCTVTLSSAESPHMASATVWCRARSLYHYIHVKEENFDLDRLIDITRQVAEGMDYLHAKNVVHGDLCTSNIFLVRSMVKIGGYGISPNVSRHLWRTDNQPLRNAHRIAPELLRHKLKNEVLYKSRTDVYSFGVVMFEMFTGQLPYPGYDPQQIIFAVSKKGLRPNLELLPAWVPPRVKTLIDECISTEPFRRPTFRSIISRLECDDPPSTPTIPSPTFRSIISRLKCADPPNAPPTRRRLSESSAEMSPEFEFTVCEEEPAGPSQPDDYPWFTALRESLANLFI